MSRTQLLSGPSTNYFPGYPMISCARREIPGNAEAKVNIKVHVELKAENKHEFQFELVRVC